MRGKSTRRSEGRADREPASTRPKRTSSRRTRPSRATGRPTPSCLQRLDPRSLGALIALYEHKVMVQGRDLGRRLVRPVGRRARQGAREEHRRRAGASNVIAATTTRRRAALIDRARSQSGEALSGLRDERKPGRNTPLSISRAIEKAGDLQAKHCERVIIILVCIPRRSAHDHLRLQGRQRSRHPPCHRRGARQLRRAAIRARRRNLLRQMRPVRLRVTMRGAIDATRVTQADDVGTGQAGPLRAPPRSTREVALA